jgi:hypothetical protein
VREVFNTKAMVIAIVALWVPAVGYGIRTLLQYANTPGRLAAPPEHWPAAVAIRPARGRATMVIFAHPQCPCSRATIGELAEIMNRCREKVDVTVFFYLPAGEKLSWTKTDLWRSATAIPGVRAIEDRDGTAANMFGVSTSGQTLLYDPGARLVFNGGITASRGHSGSNDGRDALVALLFAAVPRYHTTPVFGCSLRQE